MLTTISTPKIPQNDPKNPPGELFFVPFLTTFLRRAIFSRLITHRFGLWMGGYPNKRAKKGLHGALFQEIFTCGKLPYNFSLKLWLLRDPLFLASTQKKHFLHFIKLFYESFYKFYKFFINFFLFSKKYFINFFL